jgi:hypothetical protein
VFQGLFGIDSRGDGLSLSVRAVESPAIVRVYEPALDRYVVYRYEAEAGAARLRFESNAPGRGRLRVLLPGGARPLEVLLDGAGVSFEVETVGADGYASLETDWQGHVLDLKLP